MSSISYDNLRIFEKNGKFIVLNALAPSWIVTNINGVLILKLYDGVKTFDEIADEALTITHLEIRDKVLDFLDQAQKARLFQEQTEMPVHKPYRLNSIYLNMTEQCNLKCVYCYASSRVESGDRLCFDDYTRILDEAASMTDELNVTFTGGEPILSPLTVPVAQYAKAKGFGTYLLSNGTLINETNIDVLVECFDHFKISLDGSRKEIHEHFRGRGSFEPAFAAVKLLQQRGVDVIVPMTVTKQNIDDIPAMNEVWGSIATFQPLFPLGNAVDDNELAITGPDYYECLASGGRVNPYCDIEGIIKAHAANRTIYKCALGDGQMSISCSGDVYPCQLLHYPEFLVGNVKNSSLEFIYNSPQMEHFKKHTVNEIEGCRTCDFKYLCGGACQARHFSETGTIDKAGEFCEYEKRGIINGILDNYELKPL